MNRFKHGMLVACVVSMLAAAPPSGAQMAVVDFSAIMQLIQQVQTLQQVLANARNQLLQAQQALQSMTGSRGMQSLLGNVVRNYLPTSWTQISGSSQSLSTAYPALTASFLALVNGNAVLSSQALAALSPTDQQRITAARNTAAMNQAIARGALSNASGRFAEIQSLISTIGLTNDQKSVLELQARISAELAMLQNEQTKLQTLNQTLQADAAAAREQMQEQVVASHGQFSSRFQPAP
jgi:type IV secretion system protein VirB5